MLISIRTIALTLITSLALAAPKQYQNILMDESVSLLDYMVFKAELDAKDFLKSNKNIKRALSPSFHRYEWEYEPVRDEYSLPINYKYLF